MPAELQSHRRSALVINADDWGRDRNTTDRILECWNAGALSSTSAMMFMEDSSRAAELAQASGLGTGLHLNLSECFTATGVPAKLQESHGAIVAYIRSNKFAQLIPSPGLRKPFEYVVRTQLEEYQRLYGEPARRIDGHHHMHLCANVVWGKLLPEGTVVRRNFSFESGEKSFANRYYRSRVDAALSRRHHLTDYFFSLPPLAPESRLSRMFTLARDYFVEIETHPVNLEERKFLISGEFSRFAGDVPVSRSFMTQGAAL